MNTSDLFLGLTEQHNSQPVTFGYNVLRSAVIRPYWINGSAKGTQILFDGVETNVTEEYPLVLERAAAISGKFAAPVSA